MNAIKWYRLSRFFYKKKVPFVSRIISYTIFFLYNSVIPPEADIGQGTRCNYGGIGVVIHKRAKIGERVLIGQGVTIGGNFSTKAPVIGNDVYIAPGARVLGAVVGDNVVIGANSVVINDIPNNVIVAGVPARIIREHVKE